MKKLIITSALIILTGCSKYIEINSEVSLRDQIINEAYEIEDLYSLLVIRNDNMVIESYFNGNSQNFLNNTQSITKSILSLITGIAIEKNILADTNVVFCDYFFCENENFDKITLQNLLSMNSGISWDENRDFVPWMSDLSQVEFTLKKTIVEEPGKNFNYNSGACHLISVILSEANGSDLQEFSIKNFFRPLGIKKINWQKDTQGYFQGSTGLALTPLDITKIGQLILQKGEWNGQTIVDSAWINKILEPNYFVRKTWSEFKNIMYGDLWWMAQINGQQVYIAWGYGGQFLFIIPKLNSIVVTTAKWRIDASDASETEESILRLVTNFIIPYLKNSESLRSPS